MSQVETTLADLTSDLAVLGLLDERLPDSFLSATVERITSAADHLISMLGEAPRSVAVNVPGRIEVLGKHTDYAGGQSLTCAVRRAFNMVAARSAEPGMRITDQVSGVHIYMPFDGPPEQYSVNWSLYPQTVVRRFVSNFGIPKHGVSIVFNSDIPRASGLSSSSAFVIGIWLCLATLSDLASSAVYRANIRSAPDMASYLGCVENGSDYGALPGDTGVGTMGGAQDHAAILFSEPDYLGYFQYRPLRQISRVRLPSDLSFVIASSGVHAHKAGRALHDYNSAVHLANRATEIWNQQNSDEAESLDAVVASAEFSIDRFEKLVRNTEDGREQAEAVIARVRQYFGETRHVIPTAIRAIEHRDYSLLGQVVAESQRMADEYLKNQVPETRFLVQAAIESGAVAASAFGAGFGGSVWALVMRQEAPAFLRRWFAAYGGAFQSRLRQACFFQDTTGPGAFVLGADPDLLIEPEL